MYRHTARIIAATLSLTITLMVLKGVGAVADAQAAAAAVTPRMARVVPPASAPAKAEVQVAEMQSH